MPRFGLETANHVVEGQLGLAARAPRKRGGRASRKDRGGELMPVLVARDRSGAMAGFPLEAVSKQA
jgi:hypothetical protein